MSTLERFGYADLKGLVFSHIVTKHGSHNQKTHGRSGGGKASTSAMRAFNDRNYRMIDDVSSDYMGEVSAIYLEQYSENTDENINAEFRVENYVSSGYSSINATARGEKDFNPSDEAKIRVLDRAIEAGPDAFGDKNLYRVTSDRLITDLQPGDIFIDKGFMSTTRTNLTTNAEARNQLGEIGSSVDSVTIILPSPSRTGDGLALDTFLTSRGKDGSGEFWGKENEVLLPRNTALLFLGMSDTTDHQGKPIAIFQRMDK